MKINEDFLTANIERFDKLTHLLAAKVTGCEEDKLLAHPVIMKRGTRLWQVSIGDPENNPGPESDFILPYVINAAFSLEMCLKLLLLRESGTWKNGHNLNELYSAVSKESKTLMRATFDRAVKGSSTYKEIAQILNDLAEVQFAWDLDKLIAQSSSAFVNWRYAFEKPNKVSSFAGYYEIRIAILNAVASIS